jgi:hypothetical protein
VVTFPVAVVVAATFMSTEKEIGVAPMDILAAELAGIM